MIRQAVSCDMCGAEMHGANHWFMAIEQNGELRVSSWIPRRRSRADTLHVCGQTCLHKLVDEFVARALPGRAAAAEKQVEPAAQRTAARRAIVPPAARPMQPVLARTHEAAPEYVDEFESSARLISTPDLPATGAMRPPAAEAAAAAHMWRADAWKREREREQNHSEHRDKPLARRRSIA